MFGIARNFRCGGWRCYPDPSQNQKWSDRPYLRAEAVQDIPSVAAKYGADLLDAPRDWLDCTRAWQFLTTMGITLTMTLPVFCMEVFAGCDHVTSACVSARLSVAPSIDVLPADGGHRCVLGLLTFRGRKVLWALLAVTTPFWVHVGFPCTFWSQLAHLTRKQTDMQNEETRLSLPDI